MKTNEKAVPAAIDVEKLHTNRVAEKHSTSGVGTPVDNLSVAFL